MDGSEHRFRGEVPVDVGASVAGPADGAPARRDDVAAMLARFDRFDQSEWTAWLDAFLNGEACVPQLSLAGREPHIALSHLAGRLPSDGARARLGRALADLFEGTASGEQQAARLYYLLQLLALLRPLGAKVPVRQRLFERSLERMRFGSHDLQALAFVVSAKYVVDDPLVDFAELSAARSATVNVRIAALQMLALRNDGRAAAYLRHFLPDMREGGNAKVLERALESVVRRVGFRELQGWYHHQQQALSGDYPEGMDALREIFEHVIDWWGAGDKFALALREEITSRRALPAPEPILAIIDAETALGSDMTLGVLRRVYENAAALMGPPPWTLAGAAALMARTDVIPIRLPQQTANVVSIAFGSRPGDLYDFPESHRAADLLQAAQSEAPLLTKWLDWRFDDERTGARQWPPAQQRGIA